MDVESPHSRVDGEELAEPPEPLEGDREQGRRRRAHHSEAPAAHRDQPPHRPEHLEVDRAVMTPRGSQREREERRADGHEDDQARDRPVRDLRRHQHVRDQEHDRDEVEDAVREHRPDERRPGTSPPRQLPRQHRHARQLADPAGQYSVREQPDRERGEDEREPRPRRRHRLPDHGLPRERADEHGEQVEPDRASDPLPADDRERVSDRLPARPAPDEERDHRSAKRQDEQRTRPRPLRRAELQGATTPAGARPATSS